MRLIWDTLNNNPGLCHKEKGWWFGNDLPYALRQVKSYQAWPIKQADYRLELVPDSLFEWSTE